MNFSEIETDHWRPELILINKKKKVSSNWFYCSYRSLPSWWCTSTASLQKVKTSAPNNKCPGYKTDQFDGETSVIFELLRMRTTLWLPSLQRPLWPGVVAADSVLSMGQIELNCVLMLKWIVWNRTIFYIETVYLYSTDLFERELFCMLNWIVWNRAVFAIETVYSC